MSWSRGAGNGSIKNVAVVAILIVGGIHLWLARAAFGNAPYEGLLFEANGIGALIAADALHRRGANWGWLLGALVAASTFLGYVMSRTVGLPGLPAEPDAWFEPLGVISVVAELVFLTLFSMTRRRILT
jgi:Na+/proline symporter